MSLPATNTRCLIALLAMLAFGLLPIATAQKRGLVYNDGININGFTAPGSKITWLYNWDSATTTPYPQHWNYVPMLWGLQQDHLTVWPGRAPGHANLLSFNEPERLEQSNLTPEQAADAYRTYMHPFGDSYLGSPAVSNDGYGWLERFLQVCGDCIIDFIAVHWYDTADNVGDFTRWIDDVCRLSNGRPVVITEFQGYGSPDAQIDFLNKALPWLDQNPCVIWYSYMGATNAGTEMLAGDGLTSLGARYAFG